MAGDETNTYDHKKYEYENTVRGQNIIKHDKHSNHDLENFVKAI